MLKYRSVIEKLSVRQKVAMLSDLRALSDPNVARAGVPAIQTASLADRAAAKKMPSYESLAGAWDAELIEQMSLALATEARGEGVNLFTTPDLKCAANVYLPGLSEDAYLNGTVGAAVTRGVHAAGAACALARLSCTEADVAFLDAEEDDRVIYDLFRKPFVWAMRQAPSEAIQGSLQRAGRGYMETNPHLFGQIVAGAYGDEVFALGEDLSSDVDFHTFLTGGVCINGSALTLDRALGRYEKISRSLEAGSITERDLQGALEDGSAVRAETIDLAVDKVIDFAFRVNRIKPSFGQKNDLAAIGARAALESIVLLKNKRILPLASGKRLAVIGSECSGLEAKSSFTVTARVAGYVREEDPSELVVEEALRAASAADVLLVFLHPVCNADGSVRRLCLPANVTVLIQALAKTGKPMIGVLPANTPTEMSFDGLFSAVLAAPVESAYCAAVLAAVLDGRENPSGRLARSYYDDEWYFQQFSADKAAGKAEVGPLVGYRFYDTEGERIRYPFGFGLSYTQFVYSGLRVEAGGVSFVVRNVGKRSGCETAQIYIGAPGFPMPKKELKAFVRIPLAAGEQRRVSVELPENCFAAYDTAIRTENIATGRYAVYVGASVSDIRLRGTLYRTGERQAPNKPKKADYFSDSQRRRKYRLSEANGARIAQKRRWFRGVSLTALVLSLVAFVILGIQFFVSQADPGQFLLPSLVIAGLFLLACIAVAAENSHYKKAAVRRVKQHNLRFKSPVLENITLPEVFECEFAEEMSEEGRPKGSDEPKYFDQAFSFDVIAREWKQFSAERGIDFSQRDIRSLLASMVSSRILFLPAEKEKQVNLFGRILAEYFSSSYHICNLSLESNVVSLQQKEESNFLDAIEQAKKESAKMHVILCRRTALVGLKTLVFAKTFEHAELLTEENRGRNVFVVPPNLWIIVLFDGNAQLKELTSGVADLSALLNCELRECRSVSERTVVKPLGYFQFDNLAQSVRDVYPLEERLWKRMDRLEEMLEANAGYRIGNRTWIKMEKYISVYLACGGEGVDALDGAVATQLLVGLLDLPAFASGRTLLTLLEESFGADNVGSCRNFIAQHFASYNKTERGNDAV